ncbi:alpha/beta hydrolase [Owenweeksia hongkongensis]|uniref:alpha/beta hydrolase n=1 Tax=Owenweeksia hongkongensis TaxID=253245 RepID=UPI003A949589
MIFRIFLFVISFLPLLGVAQGVGHRKRVYLIPGQGSDYRIFKNLKLDSIKYEMCYVNWEIPEEGETMSGFARQLAAQIDTSKSFYLVGVSLGGMIAVEMSKFLNPEKVILVSSAKCRDELPFQYRLQKSIPVYRAVPSAWVKQLSFVAQPIFEPDRRLEKETCNAMLDSKSPVFLKRTINMITNWNQQDCLPNNVFHIHGDNDHTIPINNVNCDVVIKNGSHMMMLTQTRAVQVGIEMILEGTD